MLVNHLLKIGYLTVRIEDWISDSKDENETEFKTKQRKSSFAKVEFVKSNEHVKTPRESVKEVENNKQAKYPRKNSQSPRDYDFHEKKIVEKPVWNNFSRVNHQNSYRLTHPHPKRNFVPRAVLMKSGLRTLNTARQNSSRVAVSVNTVRPINTAYPNPTVNYGDVTNVGPKTIVSDNKGNEANVVKASSCWVWRPNQNVLDHVSKHNGQSTARIAVKRRDPKGGRITGKGKISTGKLDFEDVYFVKELKFNLFSVSQIYDKKNNVLFTDTQCVVLSPNFKLLDENHVLLRVPRKDNMYSVDLKNIVLSGGLTYLFAKATLDESNLWNKRLGHINFKTMNKLVRGNLVRGLPSKIFENNHTCVACQKGKPHKASCKTKTGIKREFSVARTPLQNRVAERKNRTLIEAARTMLANSKLPTTFWAEAVNIACYVQNRVLVIKPHNKTPYELFLGKFNGKANEGFFVGYSTNSKTFRLVVVGNQTNGNAGTKENIDAGQARKKIVPDQEYILLSLLTSDPSLSKSSKDSPDARFKPSREEEKIDVEHLENENSKVPNTKEPRVNQEQDESINSTNNINIVSSTVNTNSIKDNDVDENIVYGCIDDPNMPNLEDIVYFDDDEEVGAEADMNNLATTMLVSPIPTTRVHKDHPLEQIIGDIHSTPQTRKMTKSVTEHVEPKKVIQALTDPSWIEAMQDELLQFKLQKVWTLVDFSYGKRAIGT
ncbi:ribonuclease H-like domain-containing protein [Tanacetum coccineum]